MTANSDLWADLIKRECEARKLIAETSGQPDPILLRNWWDAVNRIFDRLAREPLSEEKEKLRFFFAVIGKFAELLAAGALPDPMAQIAGPRRAKAQRTYARS